MLRLHDATQYTDIDSALDRRLFVNAVGYAPASGGWTLVYSNGTRSDIVLKCYQFELNNLGLHRVDR